MIVEKTRTGYSAFSPDIPGCIATGRTRVLVERRMKSAIRFHLEGLEPRARQREPRAYSTWVEITA